MIDMKLAGIIIAVCLKIVYVQNRMVPLNYLTIQPILEESATQHEEDDENPYEIPYHKVIGLGKNIEQRTPEGFGIQAEIKPVDKTKKPCSVVVLSNVQNPSMQSLLRKYRYDANGVLIPSSVKYYIKLPQGFGSSSILVPLNDKAFSPLGGFVRYYKEVPPIPQSW